ncbi:uncharacterized protein DSM5745_10465 [Aspergillus mulundensis]|uniref:Uncharacterized protein n=1 Tax=Aspergillus mulundensis TaxID=1810919 RepID=A0A3D8QIZ2_9EURO|nr:hypothetical protein DSM5745_10465 [Aspergillus mulundensis]RDW61793.1 hypothetical protein DSM5745_10465 [Aspergillus mulundensis]
MPRQPKHPTNLTIIFNCRETYTWCAVYDRLPRAINPPLHLAESNPIRPLRSLDGLTVKAKLRSLRRAVFDFGASLQPLGREWTTAPTMKWEVHIGRKLKYSAEREPFETALRRTGCEDVVHLVAQWFDEDRATLAWAAASFREIPSGSFGSADQLITVRRLAKWTDLSSYAEITNADGIFTATDFVSRSMAKAQIQQWVLEKLLHVRDLRDGPRPRPVTSHSGNASQLNRLLATPRKWFGLGSDTGPLNAAQGAGAPRSTSPTKTEQMLATLSEGPDTAAVVVLAGSRGEEYFGHAQAALESLPMVRVLVLKWIGG